ncbi:MAG: hypothetical protein SH850_21125 [Planctomycetaceae bacterium]|nr:hypothetical protein [Planctomycetaceae bacterium]
MGSIYFVTWVTVQLLVPVILVIAARRNRSYRPQAARWMFLVAVLQIANVGLTAVLAFLLPQPDVPWDKDLPDMLADPGTWAFIVLRWMYCLLPVAMTLITTYVILEQPDRPRVARSEEPAS